MHLWKRLLVAVSNTQTVTKHLKEEALGKVNCKCTVNHV